MQQPPLDPSVADIDQEQVAVLAVTQYSHRLFMILGLAEGRAIVHGDLGGRRELALQRADNEKPHAIVLYVCSRRPRHESFREMSQHALRGHADAELVFHQHHRAAARQCFLNSSTYGC